MKSDMKRRFWTAEDDKVLRRLYPHHDSEWIAGQLDRSLSSIYARSGIIGAKKTAAYLAASLARVHANLTEVGKRFRFHKGQVPRNKGLRRPGWSAGRMKETQFKKGALDGHAAAHYKPLGSTRLVDGYLLVKVAEVPNVAYSVNWKAVHILNWERANGRPVPEGHCVVFRDRDRTNVAIDNLELISRVENMRRNSVQRLPKELVEVVMIRGRLMRQINKRTRREKQD